MNSTTNESASSADLRAIIPAGADLFRSRPPMQQPARHGEETLWIEDLGPRLYRYFSVHGSAAQATDLVQEVFLRLLPKFQKGVLTAHGSDLIPVAFGVAQNVLREARRSLLRQARLGDRAESAWNAGSSLADESLVEDLAARETLARLRQAVARLKPKEAEIVSLLLEESLTMEEIARITGLPVGTVKSHVHRARIRLKSLLDPLPLSSETAESDHA